MFEFGAMYSASSERNFSVAAPDVCITTGRPRTLGSVAWYLCNMHGPSRQDENLALERWQVCQPTFLSKVHLLPSVVLVPAACARECGGNLARYLGHCQTL